MEKIFFDNNATTKLLEEVSKAMFAVYQKPLNASSIHSFGREANKICNEAREQITQLLNAKNYSIIFTSGGTEANNLAIFGLNNFEIITSKLEHPSIYEPALKKNYSLITVENDGIINLVDLENTIAKSKSPNFLVSLMLANNETGAIQPVKEAAKLVHAKNGLIHSDLAQAIGKMKVDLEDLNIDLATISAHKIGGPQGVGALLVRKGIDLEPLIIGGGQESGKRAGTLNVAGIAGFGKACDIAENHIQQSHKIENLRNYLEEKLQEIGEEKIKIFSKNIKRIPNTSLVSTKGISNQIQLIDFDLNGIAVSIGSACSSGSAKPSRVLQAMNQEIDTINSTIRISLGLENNKEEIDKFLEIYQKLLKRNKK